MSLSELTLSETEPPLAPHLVVRGTYLPTTVRCAFSDSFLGPLYLGSENEYVAAFAGAEDFFVLNCYVDVRVNSYFVGKGPSDLTILRTWQPYSRPLLSETGLSEEDAMRNLRQAWETGAEGFFEGLESVLPGNEEILLLGLPFDFSSEVWAWWGSYGVERRGDGTVIAVDPQKPLWKQYRPDDYETYRSSLEVELLAFEQIVKKAHEDRVNEHGGRIGADPGLPMLVTDAHRLRDFFIEAGAYDHPDGPPKQPPPVQALQ